MRVAIILIALIPCALLLLWALGLPSDDAGSTTQEPAKANSDTQGAVEATGVPAQMSRSESPGTPHQGGAVEEREMQTPASRDPSNQRTSMAVFRARVDKLLRESESSRWEFEGVLRELVKDGSVEAIGLVMKCMEDERFEFANRALFFAGLLADVDDARIYPAARRVLEANLRQGRNSWSHTHGYLELVASKGGAAGATLLIDMMAKGGQLANGAARAVAKVKNPELASVFLDALATCPRVASRELANSLVAWNDPGVEERLCEMARSRELSLPTKESIYRALAEGARYQVAADVIGQYWSAPSEVDRSALVAALGGFCSSKRRRGEHGHQAVELASAIVEHALQDVSSARVWRRAVSVVNDNRWLATQGLLSRLQALHSAVASEEDKASILEAISEVKSRLR